MGGHEMAPQTPRAFGPPRLSRGGPLYPGPTQSVTLSTVMRALLWRLLYPVAALIHRLTGQPPPRPPFDERRAAALVGKYVLIGLTYHDADGRFLEQRQIHGMIVGADAQHGIEVELKGASSGETYRLPPDLRPLQPAAPGEYRLRATGEVVIDPDLLCTWSVTKPRT